jgi:hypothetical protein
MKLLLSECVGCQGALRTGLLAHTHQEGLSQQELCSKPLALCTSKGEGEVCLVWSVLTCLCRLC